MFSILYWRFSVSTFLLCIIISSVLCADSYVAQSSESGPQNYASFPGSYRPYGDGCVCDYSKNWYCEHACAKDRNTALWSGFTIHDLGWTKSCEQQCYAKWKKCCTICDYRVYYVGTASQAGAGPWLPQWDNYCSQVYPGRYAPAGRRRK